MKHLRHFFALLMLLCTSMVFSQTFEKDGINYNILDTEAKTVAVTSKTDGYSGDVVIPATVEYGETLYSVVEIGSVAFYSDVNLTSVVIPEGVTSIGSSAFSSCSSLTSLTIPEGVTSIGSSAFSGCSSLTSLTIPKSVTSIGVSPFTGCSGHLYIDCDIPDVSDFYYSIFRDSNFSEVTFGDNVQTIGDYAFRYKNSSYEPHSQLTKINIGKGIKRIGQYAFAYSGLSDISFTEGMSDATIDSYAFYNCNNLTSVELPEGVTSIGSSAFSGCSSLTSLTILEGVTSIGSSAFYRCSSLTSLTIPKSVTSIGSDAFCGCSSLTSLTIPEGVTSIGSSAFYGCSSLTSLTIPEGVTSIGIYAFNACSGLTSLTIPEGVTSIGSYAFNACSGLTSLTIPKSVTSIGNYAFQECSGHLYIDCDIPDVSSSSESIFYNSNFSEVTFGDNVQTIGDYAFKEKNGAEPHSQLTKINIGKGIKRIGQYAFAYSGLSDISFTEGMSDATIDSHAFRDCKNLESLEIAEGVTSIGSYAFQGCSSLTSLTISEGVTSIGSYAFSGCSSLTSSTIPKSVTSIGSYAFQGCSSLTSLTISEGVTSIGSSAFSGCSSLTSLTIPKSVTSIGSYAFFGCSGHLYIDCDIPDVSDSYNSIFCYSNFSEVTFGDNVQTIGDYAFRYKSISNEPHSQLTKINIGKGIKRIGQYAFAYSGLSDISFTEGMSDATIEQYAFADCKNLESLEIAEGVTTIARYAFNYCNNLTSLVIPQGVTSMGAHAFNMCSGHLYINSDIPDANRDNSIFDNSKFTEVTFDDSVQIIGDNAFNYNGGHKQLTKINLGKNVKRIGQNAFSKSALSSVELPEGVTFIGQYAFNTLDTVVVNGLTPATSDATAFKSDALIYVPTEAFSAYANADVWKGYNGLTCEDYDDMTITSEALANSSGVLQEVGDTYIRALVNLKVVGSINGYDVIIFRDKTPTLRTLDLSECTVEANDKAFYNGNHTLSDTLGHCAFYNLPKLRKVKLPQGLKTIGDDTFRSCSNLAEIEIPSTVKSIGNFAFYGCNALLSVELPRQMDEIGSDAFYNCTKLDSIVIPEGIKKIQSYTFENCAKLKKVYLPKGVEHIGSGSFRNTGLEKISLPPTVKEIGSSAFSNSTSLSELRIPSSILRIYDNAFSGCNNLLKVYTYTVEPTSINENTFSTFDKATLYVPKQSYWNYYWDDGWKRFLTYEQFNEPYEYFYVNNDYTLNDDTGYIEGVEGENPDADINAGGGLVVEGEQTDDEAPNQNLGDVNVNTDDKGNSGSIIGDNNLHIDDLHIKINVKGGRWYFFAFPFDIKLNKISMENGSNYVFRYYDGAERAHNGKNGWKNVNGNKLNAAQGYIFQCSVDDVLVLDIEDVRFKKEDKYTELVAHVSDNSKDASWNFVGNPYLSYYDMVDMNYSAPVTIWDGSKYVAIRPGDDDYHFAPYEAFFVQKPESQNTIGFDGEQQMTSKQSKAKKEKQSEARKVMMSNMNAKMNPRKLVNLTLSNNEQSDGTRIVFNNAQSMAYEADCDAAKFETQGVVQLYSLGEGNVRYAINERPEDKGVVKLGYIAPSEGVYTLEAVRMDMPVFVKDLKTGALHDLSKGAYTFSTDGGTYANRLEILTGATVTGINDVNATEQNTDGHKVYDMSGRRVQDNTNGVYIVDGKKTLVK